MSTAATFILAMAIRQENHIKGILNGKGRSKTVTLHCLQVTLYIYHKKYESSSKDLVKLKDAKLTCRHLLCFYILTIELSETEENSSTYNHIKKNKIPSNKSN